MTAEECVEFLKALNAKKIKVKGNGWVEASCPLAPWTHGKRHDHSPSFGLSISPGERSRFSCFACRSGSAEELVQTLQLYAKDHTQYNFALCHQLLTEEAQVLPLPAYGEFKQSLQMFSEWPQYWLDTFMKVKWVEPAYNYLNHRNVPQTIWETFDLRYDSKREMIVAPYWDVFGRFAGARGRTINEAKTGAAKHYDYSYQSSNNNRLVWYNERVLNSSGPVVVVEGQFDCWRVSQVYGKTVAALTAKPTWEKFKKLGDCPVVVQIPDRDETGHQSMELYAKYCKELGVEYRPLLLDEGVKDPDECHPDYLKDKIDAVLSA